MGLFGRKNRPAEPAGPPPAPPDGPHIRLYRPGGAFECFERELSMEEMSRIAGMEMIIRYSPGCMDMAYAGAEAMPRDGPRTCVLGREALYGPLFLGRYDGSRMRPIDPGWFEAVDDDSAYDLIVWNGGPRKRRKP